jgi:Carboxypeptidase regulatory-like domain
LVTSRTPGSRRSVVVAAAFLVPAVAIPALVAVIIAGRGGSKPAARRVTYAQVQAVFDQNCTSCHPAVNPSLDLTPVNSYASLINQRALEDPNYLRVVVGDPARSFLYLKVAGFGPQARVGGRMPLRRPPLPAAQVAIIRQWILQGARGPGGKLPPPAVATPGSEPPLLKVPAATTPTGTGAIRGTVRDQEHRPIAGALVTLLLRGPAQPGGEEHYRVAVTDARGRYALANAPAGRFELKAYAPKRIYVSHFVGLAPAGTATIDFGLPNRALQTPTVSHARVQPAPGGAERLSMTVQGPNLDPNYTLAVNPRSGRVFELHSPGARPGTWSRTIPHPLSGKWIFLAVDRLCSVSAYITVARP